MSTDYRFCFNFSLLEWGGCVYCFTTGISSLWCLLTLNVLIVRLTCQSTNASSSFGLHSVEG